MTELLQPRAMGRDLVRRDGEAKVRGIATYAYEAQVEHPAYCALIQSSIARGQVRAMDTTPATALDGVLHVLTVFDGGTLASTADRELAILLDTIDPAPGPDQPETENQP